MIRSMTGFARTSGRVLEDASETGTWTMSVKSVNHRFLDVQLRLPSGCDALEMELRRRLKQRVLRGHLDVALNFERAVKAQAGALAYDRELVVRYVAAFRAAREELGLAQEPDLNTIFRMPGVFGGGGQGNSTAGARNEEREATAAALQAAVLAELDGLLDALDAMRAAEGAALTAVLRDALAQLEKDVKAAATLRARVQAACHQRLRDRMRDLLGAVADEGRLLQEAVLLADRSDVEEETARLAVHIEHFRNLLGAGGEVGKKLDFLLQEMNREANTLLSKSAGIPDEGARITELGLGMKSVIEKMREQVQNLE